MALPVLGIDIAKASFETTLLMDGKLYHRTFSNRPSQFLALTKWLGKHKVDQLHACWKPPAPIGKSWPSTLPAGSRRQCRQPGPDPSLRPEPVASQQDR